MLFLFFGALITILSGLASFKEKLIDNKKDNKGNTSNIITFCLLVVGSIISFWGGCNENKAKKVSEKKADSINNLIIQKQKDIDSITNVSSKLLAEKQELSQQKQEIILDTTRSVLFYSQQLNKAQKDLIKLQSEQTKKLIGDGSMPQLFSVASGNSNLIHFFLYNNSNYPISDIKISIIGPLPYDFNILNKDRATPKNEDTYVEKRRIQNYNIGTLRAHSGYQVNDEENSIIINKGTYTCSVSWLYGSYIVDFSFKRIDEKRLIVDSTVYRYNNGKEFIFPNSILNPKNKINPR